jgi:hypothetical protein
MEQHRNHLGIPHSTTHQQNEMVFDMVKPGTLVYLAT